MHEITQLREHLDRRCNSQDAKLDQIRLAVVGDGMLVEGLAAKTAKNAHDINNVKQTLGPLVSDTQYCKSFVNGEKRWRRLIISAIVGTCATVAAAQITMAVKATAPAAKGTP